MYTKNIYYVLLIYKQWFYVNKWNYFKYLVLSFLLICKAVYLANCSTKNIKFAQLFDQMMLIAMCHTISIVISEMSISSSGSTNKANEIITIVTFSKSLDSEHEFATRP